MSAATLSPVLTRALQAGRSQFNARVAEAARVQPGFDTAAVEALLQGPLNQLAEALADQEAGRVNSLLLAAFDTGLTLILRGKADLPLVRAVWADLVPACASLALNQPRETLGILFNAALYLESINGVRQKDWLIEMEFRIGNCTDLASLRAVGQILAWRAGVAHFRQGALQVARTLPAALALAVLTADPDGDINEVLARLAADPWFDPANPDSRGLCVRHKVGGFSGFGGPFAQPPVVRALPDGFAVRCADRYWYLCVDAFGAVLHAGSEEEFAAGSEDASPLRADAAGLHRDGEYCESTLPPEGLSIVCNQSAAALCSPHSHFIHVVALA